MLFNSLTFLVFFLIVLLLHRLPFSWRQKKLNLLLASYAFYAAWNPPFVVLLWISTLVDWFVARKMSKTEGTGRRRRLLLLSLSANLGLLGYFKYGGFLLKNFIVFLGLLGVQYQPPSFSMVLPIGISFYTFQTLSYTFDVYRRKTRPWHSFLDYALFVTFFPQLVAGPIVRAVYFLPQCVEPKRTSAQQLGWGFALLVIGLFQKVVLADWLLAPVADAVYGAVGTVGTLAAWVGTLAFSGQIFCDFAGYSSCAIGVGLCLGFVIPDNFRFPYAAIGFSDFWRRWHVSLSSWLRDYLYIPLGGNRKGTVRTYVNIMLTMLIGGLWHGAAWHFVVWGGLHGLYLLAERVARRLVGELRALENWLLRSALVLVTFFVVSVTWVFFRAQDIGAAWGLCKKMFLGGGGGLELPGAQVLGVVVVMVGLLMTHWTLRDSSVEEAAGRMSWWLRSLLLAAMLVALALTPGYDRAFIYFQF